MYLLPQHVNYVEGLILQSSFKEKTPKRQNLFSHCRINKHQHQGCWQLSLWKYHTSFVPLLDPKKNQFKTSTKPLWKKIEREEMANKKELGTWKKEEESILWKRVN